MVNRSIARSRLGSGVLLLTLVITALVAGPAPAEAVRRDFPSGWTSPLSPAKQFEDWGFASCNPPYDEDNAHLGADSQGSGPGDAVYAMGTGTVARVVASNWGPGGAIGIEHVAGDGSRFLAVYGHVVNISVSVGNPVQPGQQIASLYNWATTSGDNSHLHLGVKPLAPDEPANQSLWGAEKCTSTAPAPTHGFVDPIPWLTAHPKAGGNTSYESAFQANTGSLHIHGDVATANLQQGMAPATSPSVALPASGGYQTAFQANTGDLIVYGTLQTAHLSLGMLAGTSPSIATGTGGFKVAFQANTGHLYTYSPGEGARDLGFGMMRGTSPSIAALPGGGYAIAFHANTGNLFVVGDVANVDTGQGMMAGTSPSIAAAPSGGYKAAFQANTGNLHSYIPGQAVNHSQGMDTASSPVIAALAGGGYQMAFQANTHNLIVFGDAGSHDTQQGMMPGSSPAIASSPAGGYRAAFQANTGNLYYYVPGQASNLQLGMMADTSPCITGGLGGGCAPGAHRLRSASPPTVTGTAAVGAVLAAAPGGWSTAGAVYTYQWRAAGVDIAGATGATYSPVAGDVGKAISVRVAASKAGYASGTATSAATSAVAKGAITNTTRPSISGKKRVGKTLTANPGAWSVSGLAVTFHWLRDGKAISTATSRTYGLKKADKGHQISVRITVTKNGYIATTATSPRTAKIKP